LKEIDENGDGSCGVTQENQSVHPKDFPLGDRHDSLLLLEEHD